MVHHWQDRFPDYIVFFTREVTVKPFREKKTRLYHIQKSCFGYCRVMGKLKNMVDTVSPNDEHDMVGWKMGKFNKFEVGDLYLYLRSIRQ
jgi:hypothetical protein